MLAAQPRAAFAAPARGGVARRATVQVVCAKRTKAADFRALSTEEALSRLAALKKEKMQLQYFQRSRGAILNPENKE
jgi:ribosomal protein L29